jgi:cytochrome c oxidase subunit 3
MSISQRSAAIKFQNFGFHLVTKSPWPILLSFSLFNSAIGAVLSMHGFNHGANVLSLGLIVTVFGMLLWFRDVVMEGIKLHHLAVRQGQNNIMFYN